MSVYTIHRQLGSRGVEIGWFCSLGDLAYPWLRAWVLGPNTALGSGLVELPVRHPGVSRFPIALAAGGRPLLKTYHGYFLLTAASLAAARRPR